MTRDFVALDTFPKILRDNAAIFKGRPSIREKEYGIWQITTWNNFLIKPYYWQKVFIIVV